MSSGDVSALFAVGGFLLLAVAFFAVLRTAALRPLDPAEEDAKRQMDRDARMGVWPIDPRFDTQANADVMEFLRRAQPSAHSDVAQVLVASSRDCAELTAYCPDAAHCAFMALHQKDSRIVGLAYGQSDLALRLPGEALAEAVAAGGVLAPQLGAGWVRFEPFGELVDLVAWCHRAAQS